MIIYIWRHGKAEKDSTTGKDQDRVLAPEGRNEIIDVADYCFGVKGLEKPVKIFTSPYLRAKETAEMIQGFLGCESGLEIIPELKSGADFYEMISALSSKVKDLKCVAIIGHIPDMESLAFGFQDKANPVPVRLNTSGLVQIEISSLQEPFQGKLVFSLNPEEIPT